jgi:chromosomal replication initiation ATPase DnaA
MAMNALKDPAFVIGNQTFKIIRLENDLRQKDKELVEKYHQIKQLQEKVVYLTQEVEKAKTYKPRLRYNSLPLRQRKKVAEPIHEDIIKNTVAGYFGFKLKELAVKSRKRELVVAREWIIYFLFTHTHLTLRQIGEVFSRDHTTVLHASNLIKSEIDRGISKKLYEILKSKCLSEAQKHL